LTNTDVSEYPFVSRTDKNNGIDIWVGKQNKPLEDGVCLSIGLDTQTVFYRDVPFYTGQNIQILRHDEMKKMQCFFVKTILDNMIKAKFVWGGRGCTLGRFKNEYILLPSIKTNGTIKPNWKYMGDCMEQLYEKNIFLLKKNKNLINKFID
jgi:hypothetical protein